MTGSIATATVTIRPDLAGFRAEAEASIRSALSNVTAQATVGADTRQAVTDIDSLRAKLEALSAQVSNARVGVEDGDARAKLDAFAARLDQLGRSTARADVSIAHVAEADAELESVRRELERVDGYTARASVHIDGADRAATDAASAGSGLGVLAGAAISLGPALVPAGAAILGLSAALASMGAAAVAGGGVIALALSGIKDAYSAVTAQQQSAGADATAYAKAVDAASNALQTANAGVRNSQQALAQAEQTVANQRISAAEAVRNAEASLARVKDTTANAAITAAEAVTAAERSLGTTEIQVAQQREQAARTVEQAEYSLAQANLSAASAQHALNDAREQATRDLESSANRQVDSQLAAEQAALSLTTAQQNLDKVNSTATSTDLQRQQAALNVAQAQQRLIEAQQSATHAIEDNTAAQAAGVDGAPRVLSAAQQLTNAQHSQQTATEALTAAQEAQTRQVVTGAEQIAAAQQRVSDTLRAQHQQAEQGAFQVAAAEQRVTDALRSQQQQAEQGAYSLLRAHEAVAAAIQSQRQAQENLTTAADTTSAASQKAAAALAALSPAGQDFVRFLTDVLRPAMKTLRDAAQAGLLPGLQDAFQSLMPLVPAFAGFIGGLATVMGDLFREAAQALKAPFWHEFFDYVGRVAGPNVHALGDIIGNIVTGFAGLMMAFAPVAQQIVDGLVAMTTGFSNFGQQAGESSSFHTFLTYVMTEGPVVWDALKNIAVIFGHLIEGLAPLGDLLLGAIDGFAHMLALLSPTELLGAIAGVAGAFVVLTGGVGGLVVAGVALVGLLVNLYEHNKSVHDFIDQHLLPVFHEIATYLRDTLFPIIKHIGEDALAGLKTAFGFVRDMVKDNSTELNQLKTAFETVAKFVIEHILPLLGPVLKFAFEAFGLAIGGGIHALGDLVDAFDWVIKAWLTVVDTLLKGAATAFGWVPGLGGKLKHASAAFDAFRDDVNKSLDGIKNKTIEIHAISSYVDAGASEGTGGTKGQTLRAEGGPIFGPGTETSDSIPARLSNNEHVWTAREVAAAGGHEAVTAMRAAVIRGFADGGPVFDIRTQTPAAASISGPATSWLDALAAKMSDSLGLGGPAAVHVHLAGFKGIEELVRALGFTFGTPTYGQTVGGQHAAGSEHYAGRAVDFGKSTSPAAAIAAALVPYAAGGGFSLDELIFAPLGIGYKNGVNIGEAGYGAQTWADHRDHVHAGTPTAYDGGGVARGVGFLTKNTPEPERILSPQQTAAFDRLVDHLDRGLGTGVRIDQLVVPPARDAHAAGREVTLALRMVT